MKGLKKTNHYNTKPIWLLLVLLVLIAYYPALKNQWTKWDDVQYTLDNPLTQNLSIKNIKCIFSTPYQGNYVPLSYFSFALDRALWGDSPKGFIAVNIFLHLINSLLVYILISTLIQNKLAGFASALLFGIHPMHVESVAWIAERKDVLYALFYFLSMLTYITYVKTKKIKWLFLSLVGMMLSVLSKNVAIVLPFSLFIMDYVLKRKHNDKKIFLEKIPFLIVAVIFGYIGTSVVKNNADVLSSYHLSFIERLVMASYAYVNYLSKLIFPVQLSAYYPYPFLSNQNMPFYLCTYLVATVGIAVLVIWRGRKNMLMLFSFLFFTINILPALQFFPVGDAIYADRFVYVASFGFFLQLSLIINFVLIHNKHMLVKYAIMAIATIALFISCMQRVAVWKNTKTLWTDVLRKNENVSLAHANLGNAFMEQAVPDSAIIHYEKALRINPSNTAALNNKASVYFRKKEYVLAINDYKKVLTINPQDADAYAGTGICYYYTNKFDSALYYYNRYFALDSSNAGIYVNSGLTNYQLKNYNEALNDYSKAIKILPEYADAYAKRGVLKFEMQDTIGACKDWYKASRLGMMEVNTIIKTYCK